ncbi:SgcJ/EcaC family oxidoreductase [Streptosporangium sandarakinum]
MIWEDEVMPPAPVEMAHHVAAALQEAHAREDVDRYVGLFDVASTWITSRGALIVGRKEPAEYLARVMPGGLAGGSVACRVAHARPAGDGAVVVVIEQEHRRADGALKEVGGRHRHTYVVTTEPAGEWSIVAGHNTTVGVDA